MTNQLLILLKSDCFTNTSQLLLKNLPQTTASHHKCLGTSNPTSMFFYPTTTFELFRLISETPSKFSAGWDGIPSILLKYLSVNALSALSYVFNFFLSQGKFITFFKHAKVILLFKKGNTKNAANYRPISLLSNFSKIFKKISHRRLYSFFNNSNLLSNHQFDFRQGHSTSHVITLLTDKVTTAFENKQSTLGIFLDLSKAFDTIDHKVLLNKLYHYGVRGILSWFKSHLTDRTQQTEVLGTKSTNINKLTSSVPQGLILGPILFIIHVNDFPKCLRYSSRLAFADDTTILISGKNQKNLYDNANEELNNIDNWLVTNKLSLNIDKIKCMHFKTLNTPTPNLTLKIRNSPIQKISSFKLLGVILDEHLSWKDHILPLKKKLQALLVVTMKIKPCLSKDFLLIIYHSLLISHIRYCINNWCFENSTLIRKLQSICNRFLKITFNLRHNRDVTEAMKDAQLLTINNLYNLEIAQMMFKYENKQLSQAFNNFFTQKSLKMKTRSNSQIISNCFRTKVSQQSLKFVGPKLWNKITSEISLFACLTLFGHRLLVLPTIYLPPTQQCLKYMVHLGLSRFTFFISYFVFPSLIIPYLLFYVRCCNHASFF